MADPTATVRDSTDTPASERGMDPVAPPPATALGGAPPAADAAGLGRRRFFRQFAGDIANTAATMLGAAQALQRTSVELAREILEPSDGGVDDRLAAAADAVAASAGAPTFRTSFRLDGPTIRFVDQRSLPRAVTEHTSVSAAEVCWAIRNEVVQGGPAIGQAAAIGLALTAERVRETRPYARRATLRGAANALTNTDATHASIGWAVRRVMAAYEAAGELDEDGGRIAEAMAAEADRLVAEVAEDHGRLIDVGLAALADFVQPAEGPLRILVHGQSGALAGGQVGTALSIAIAAHHAGREIRVVVPEARPGFAGARVTCWELAAAGVPYLLVADAAAPSLIAGGEVDVFLVPANRVAANGDVAATIGTYPLALVAHSRSIPVLVCAPISAVDPETPDGASITIGTRPASELDWLDDTPLAPRGTEVRVPAHDVTPAELIDAFITGDGIRRPPFAPSETG